MALPDDPDSIIFVSKQAWAIPRRPNPPVADLPGGGADASLAPSKKTKKVLNGYRMPPRKSAPTRYRSSSPSSAADRMSGDEDYRPTPQPGEPEPSARDKQSYGEHRDPVPNARRRPYMLTPTSRRQGARDPGHPQVRQGKVVRGCELGQGPRRHRHTGRPRSTQQVTETAKSAAGGCRRRRCLSYTGSAAPPPASTETVPGVEPGRCLTRLGFYSKARAEPRHLQSRRRIAQRRVAEPVDGGRAVAKAVAHRRRRLVPRVSLEGMATRLLRSEAPPPIFRGRLRYIHAVSIYAADGGHGGDTGRGVGSSATGFRDRLVHGCGS